LRVLVKDLAAACYRAGPLPQAAVVLHRKVAKMLQRDLAAA
jgi:hypothetical protein